MLPTRTKLSPTASKFYNGDWNELFDWSSNDYSNKILTIPAANVINGPDQIEIEIAVPGMQKSDFEIVYEKQSLIVRSVYSEANSALGTEYNIREFSFSNFERSFILDERIVDANKISARYDNGLLIISLPKKEEAKEKPPRSITIS